MFRVLKKKLNIYTVALAVFMLLFFIFMNLNNHQEMMFDEAVRATQGAFFYDYFKTVLSDGFIPFSDFFDVYNQKYSIGWGVVYPAPAHAILQAVIFLFMGGISAWGAKLATQIFALAGIVFMYLLSSKVFKSRLMGLISSVFIALSPFNFEYSRIGMHTIAIMSMNLAWFYFLFYHKGKKIVVGITKQFSIPLRSSALWAGLFLAIATLMKYQTMIFAVIFGLVYSLYLIFKEMDKTKVKSLKSFFAILNSSGATQLFWDYVLAGIIFLLLGWWWIKFSLIDHGMFEKIKYEGLGRETWQQNGWLYPINPITKLFYIPLEFLALNTFVWLFAAVPFILSAWKRVSKGKGSTFVKENPHLWIYVLVVYIFFTYIMAHHELRYAVHIFPMVAIFAVEGIRNISQMITSNKKHALTLFFIIFFAISTFFIIKDYHKTQYYLNTFGAESNELPKYILSKPDPKFIINIKGDGMRTINYYYSPELYVFKFMAYKQEHDPRKINHQYIYTYWTQLGQGDMYIRAADQMSQISKKMDVYVFMFKYDPDDKIEKLGSALIRKGFKEKDISYFKIYEKGPDDEEKS